MKSKVVKLKKKNTITLPFAWHTQRTANSSPVSARLSVSTFFGCRNRLIHPLVILFSINYFPTAHIFSLKKVLFLKPLTWDTQLQEPEPSPTESGFVRRLTGIWKIPATALQKNVGKLIQNERKNKGKSRTNWINKITKEFKKKINRRNFKFNFNKDKTYFASKS